MSLLRITNKEISLLNDSTPLNLPKYIPQIINLANQNAQGTRPHSVGQLSELFPQFISEVKNPIIQDWEKWYSGKYPDAIENATNKIMNQINNLKEAFPQIERQMVTSWVKDLIINKTYNGMYYQKAIIKRLAEIQNKTYRLSTPQEESQGIDGYIGDSPVSIKPITYNTMARLSETIEVQLIKYEVKKDHIEVHY